MKGNACPVGAAVF